MEWYKTLLAIILWDLGRMWVTAWLTSRMIRKDKQKRKEEHEAREALDKSGVSTINGEPEVSLGA